MAEREYPTTMALLERASDYPRHGSMGLTTGFDYSSDELASLLTEMSKRVAVGVHDIENHSGGDMVSLRITVYVSFARSEYEPDAEAEASAEAEPTA